jgi:hypothetical protein
MKDSHMIRHLTLMPALGLLLTAVGGCGGGGGGGGPSVSAPVASLNPTSLTFPLQMLSTASSPKTVTLKNTGNATLALSASPITLTGTDAADYSFTHTCGTSLAASASCSINVTFTPSSAGTRSATLNVASNATGSPATVAISGSGAGDNALAIAVTSGPPGSSVANIAYTSVTFCTPGNSNQCAVVDHIQIDTGSYGLRVFKTALDAASGSKVVPAQALVSGTNDPLFECVQYADGYTWGSVATADVKIGSRSLSNLRIQLTGTANYVGPVPTTCSNGATAENSVALFGANGILGIGTFLQDCGGSCTVLASPQTGWYYQCPAATACAPVGVSLAEQVWNPVALMTSDNNGVLLKLPAVVAPGAVSVDGLLIFGVNTQSDNMVGNASWVVMPATGNFAGVFTTTVTGIGTDFPGSFIDSGSNAYFFGNAPSTLPVCKNAINFYCPVSPLTESATIKGTNGLSIPVQFTVDNAETLFNQSGADYAYPNLAGTLGATLSGAFDWGLPFFFGRPVYVLFEGQPGPAGSGVTGPANAF